MDLDACRLTIDGGVQVELAFRSIYNVYNILAAYAVCRECGVDSATAAGVISNYILKNGRVQKFRLGDHAGMLLISKHENSIAYDTNLRYIRENTAPCTVMVLVDAVSRKYFTGETSWLWDIDFEQLNCEHVEKVLLCGRYANDLAVRFSFTGIPAERLALYPQVTDAVAMLKENGGEDVYLVTCFADQAKVMDLPDVKKEEL